MRTVLLGKLSAQGGALPGKSKGKNYVEVAQKIGDRKCTVMEIPQPVVAGSSAQDTEEAKKCKESESKDEEVVVREKSRMLEKWRL